LGLLTWGQRLSERERPQNGKNLEVVEDGRVFGEEDDLRKIGGGRD